MQEENERLFDKNLTMCMDCGNGRGKLEKTNFPHISFLYSGFCFTIFASRLNVQTYALKPAIRTNVLSFWRVGKCLAAIVLMTYAEYIGKGGKIVLAVA